ncbi:MAG: hypothetical protein RJB08_1894 [Actinomycetota bacterium]
MTATRLLSGSTEEGLDAAVEILVSGGVVALPTETVYGLAADAGNESAVHKIFASKGRPTTHPLIAHVADPAHARVLAADWPASAELLAEAFWPGPLTLLVEKSDAVPSAVTGGRSTVAIRVPAHPIMLQLLSRLHEKGVIGLAAPSANRFGSISPTSAQHVLDDLDGLIDAVLDGGECNVGVESTIIDCTNDPLRVLRPGGVPTERIEAVLKASSLDLVESFDTATDKTEAIAPGMLESHYAPESRLEIFETEEQMHARLSELNAEGSRCVVLPHPTNVDDYSRTLYANLRVCDVGRPDVILAVLPAAVGLGVAIRDRLRKASAAR